MLSSIIIGGGPGGLGPLIWAAQHGVLANWLDQGIAIVDREEHLGGGLGRYAINSDSLGGAYLEFLDAPALPDSLRCLHDDPVTREMAQYRDGFPPLPLVDRFMRRVGMAIETILADRPAAVFHRRTEARALQLRSDGLVTVETVLIDGSRRILTARSAVIALGGRQSTEQVLLPDLTLAACQPRHLMPSDHLLSHAGLEQAEHLLAAAGRRQIVVLGGSHSAYAVAWALLRMPAAARLAPGQIMIIQRRPPPIFYADCQNAEADLYPVVVGDICPRTQRVNRLGGLRGNGREIWRQIAQRPQAMPEPRVVAWPLQQFSAASLRFAIEEAALVIPAFGYRAVTLPIFHPEGQRLALSADCNRTAVDDDCRVLLANGETLPTVFGIGLGTGYRPASSMGGEPNFAGQANSLWLYQNDIGAVIYRAVQALLPGKAPASLPERPSAAQSPLHVVGDGDRLQRSGVAVLACPDARLRAFGGDLASGVAENVADGEGAAAELRDLAFDDECLAGLRGALEGAFRMDQRRALFPLPARDVVALQARGQEQAIGRLIEPAEIGGIVDDACGIAVAPLNGDSVAALEGHVPRPPPAGRL